MRSAALVGCMALVLSLASPTAGREPTDAVDPLASFRLEVSLRGYAVYPKFRFRDGHSGRPGDSFRTQRIGLDEWGASPGATAGLWLLGTEWIGLHAWMFGGGGDGTLTRDMDFNVTTLPRGSHVRTAYQLAYVAVEYLHRFELLDGLVWIGGGLRLEYLDFRANVAQVGRVKVEAAWPSPR
jgi:hypothetical protein